jgi:hypothetical protein
MSSSSHYRREGRNAFYRGGNPTEINPYAKRPGLVAESHARDWAAGWLQAAEDDEMAKRREEQAALDDFDKVQEFARLYNLAKEQGLIE